MDRAVATEHEDRLVLGQVCRVLCRHLQPISFVLILHLQDFAVCSMEISCQRQAFCKLVLLLTSGWPEHLQVYAARWWYVHALQLQEGTRMLA